MKKEELVGRLNRIRDDINYLMPKNKSGYLIFTLNKLNYLQRKINIMI